MDPFGSEAVRAAYDTAADEYAAAFADDLQGLGFDRSILDAAFAESEGAGPILDAGCGPGQVADYLIRRGRHVVGIDLAPRMLQLAARRSGSASFACADLRALPIRDRSCAGVVAFYSVHHLPRSALGAILAELSRVLAPRGVLVLATHLGVGEVYIDEFLGHRIDTVGGTLYDGGTIVDELGHASMVPTDVRTRRPLAHEFPSERIYVTARKGTT